MLPSHDLPSGAPPRRALWIAAALIALAGLVLGIIGLAILHRGLPEVATLKNLQLQVPLRVLSADGQLIGEFGTERRAIVKLAEMPAPLIQAFLAAEDGDFYHHGGVDYLGLLRAVLKLVSTGDKAQGGSTITMQLARNVFLTSEKTFTRKFREILLARNIEHELTKDEILELYLNKIYLGERAYGVGAAALTYFGKPLEDLDLAEVAVLAGLPKAPSRDNPVANPERARERRDYVLRRMHDLGHIDDPQYESAIQQPIKLRPYRARVEVEAAYAAEMVRAELYSRYGEEAYTRGLTAVTTVVAAQQAAASASLKKALQSYDERHGWRGPEGQLKPEQMASPEGISAALAAYPEIAGLEAAIVVDATAEKLRLVNAEGTLEVSKDGLTWGRFTPKKGPAPGDVVRLKRSTGKNDAVTWKLSQLPEVQGAFVALNPSDGAILALAGGYDFWLSKFNHVTQARRQAGSGFKPFLYAAGLAQGYSPASIFLDAPVVFDNPDLESSWRPENYDNDFNGPMRLREALVQSRNMVSIRLLQAVGLDNARQYAQRFGFATDRLPNDLTIALGSAAFTPLEMAKGYAVFANGGYAVEPYLIDEIRDAAGSVIFKAEPRLACPNCEAATPAAEGAQAVPETRRAPRTIEPEVAWLMTSMLHDVTIRGTAAAVAQLGRNDLAGKTGTTNDETDAWFNGYQKDLVGVAWVGFDQPRPLGRGEVGGRAALPIWMDFMKAALKGKAQGSLPRPSGLVDVRINPRNGKLAAADAPGSLYEVVQQDHIPEADDADAPMDDAPATGDLF